MASPVFLSVGEVAQDAGVEPRVISDLLYARKLSTERCPIVGGRRLIPSDYLPEIKRVLHGTQKADATTETVGVAS